jgi:TIR domain
VTDIFLSYKSEDRELIAPIAKGLESEGFTVWWDRKIVKGTTYREVIEQAIANCSVVVVAWSQATEDSDQARWVFGEVDEAARRAKRVLPIVLEPCAVPLEYRATQAADLSGWKGDRNATEWRDLIEGLRHVLSLPAKSAAPAASGKTIPKQAPKRSSPVGLIAAVAALFVVGAAAATWWFDPLGWRASPGATLVVQRLAPLPADLIGDGLARANAAFPVAPDAARTVRGGLPGGESDTHEATLPGLPLIIYGICDCDDLDLVLVNALGATIASDGGSERQAVLRVAAMEGAATLRVRMYSCPRESCAYAVRFYPGANLEAPISDGPERPWENVSASELPADPPPPGLPATLRTSALNIETAGRRVVFAPTFSAMKNGWRTRVEVPMDANTRYVFFAACGHNCADIDLAVLDAAGEEVAAAGDVDVNPSLEYTPTTAGAYTFEADMFQCAEDVLCRFGLSAFAYPAAR